MAKIRVYYDGACPVCLKEMAAYRKFERKDHIDWYDITGKEEVLRGEGIDPNKALKELHIRDENGQVVTEVDAFILLWDSVWLFKPLAWLVSIPPIKAVAKSLYSRFVLRRLRRDGRLP